MNRRELSDERAGGRGLQALSDCGHRERDRDHHGREGLRAGGAGEQDEQQACGPISGVRRRGVAIRTVGICSTTTSQVFSKKTPPIASLDTLAALSA